MLARFAGVPWDCLGPPRSFMRVELTPLIPRGGSWPAFRPTAYESDAFGQRLIPLARRWQRHRTLQSAPRMLAISFGLALLVVLGATALGLSRLVIGLALLPVLIPIFVLVARALVAPPSAERGTGLRPAACDVRAPVHGCRRLASRRTHARSTAAGCVAGPCRSERESRLSLPGAPRRTGSSGNRRRGDWLSVCWP